MVFGYINILCPIKMQKCEMTSENQSTEFSNQTKSQPLKTNGFSLSSSNHIENVTWKTSIHRVTNDKKDHADLLKGWALTWLD